VLDEPGRTSSRFRRRWTPVNYPRQACLRECTGTRLWKLKRGALEPPVAPRGCRCNRRSPGSRTTCRARSPPSADPGCLTEPARIRVLARTVFQVTRGSRFAIPAPRYAGSTFIRLISPIPGRSLLRAQVQHRNLRPRMPPGPADRPGATTSSRPFMDQVDISATLHAYPLAAVQPFQAFYRFC